MKKYFLLLTLFCVTSATGYYLTDTVSAQEVESISELEDKIEDQQDKIKKLDREIAEQQSRLIEANKQTSTLQGAVNNLDATEKKLLNNISKTESSINEAQLTIQKIELEIEEKETSIEERRINLRSLVQAQQTLDDTSFLERILLYESFSGFWDEVNQLQALKKKIQENVFDLQALQNELDNKKQEEEIEVGELASQKITLASEQESVSVTKQEKVSLLTVTKNVEKQYQTILEQKKAERDAFEAALLEFESQLQTLIDPNAFPEPKRGLIGWPVSPVIITQNFGGSQFAKNNPHIYGRAFHNGSDFGVPTGTPVKSVLDGVVQASGNTDAFPGCRSWGKWILVKHNNGLSSLYAHLSSIQVSAGQTVSKGGTIGLSGNTGVSTGPHLHLTLYASQGVDVVKFSEFKKGGSGCAATGAATPVAPLDAYIDPMSYLPNL